MTISLNCHLSISFIYGDFFLCKRFFQNMESSLSLLTFIAFPLCHNWKAFLDPKVIENSPMFTSNGSEFLHLNLIPLELILAYCVRCGSNFIFSQMVTYCPSTIKKFVFAVVI